MTIRHEDEIEVGTMLCLKERGYLLRTAVPCTVVAVHREDSGVVSQLIVRREDTGQTLFATKPTPNAYPGQVTQRPITPLEWLVHGGHLVTTPRKMRAAALWALRDFRRLVAQQEREEADRDDAREFALHGPRWSAEDEASARAQDDRDGV